MSELDDRTLMPTQRRPLRPEQIEVVDDEMARIYRAMSGAERLAVANGMFRSASSMLRPHLRAEHPDWSEERVGKEAALREVKTTPALRQKVRRRIAQLI